MVNEPVKVAEERSDTTQKARLAASVVDAPLKHHESYYIEDGNIVFLIYSQIFKIHRYFMQRESGLFKDMFSLKQPHGNLEGSDDDHPLVLTDVTIEEMEALLNYCYCGMDDTRKVPLDEWVALLSISERYDCPRTHSRAMREIDKAKPPLEPIRMLVLARKHMLPEWRLAAYVAMCKMHDFVSDDDAEVLGARETARLARARARVVRETIPPRPQIDAGWGAAGGGGWGAPAPAQTLTPEPQPTILDEVVIKIVKEVFEL